MSEIRSFNGYAFKDEVARAQAAQLSDEKISKAGGKNLINIATSTEGVFIDTNTGNLTATAAYDTTDFIKVRQETIVFSALVRKLLAYDVNKVAIADTYVSDAQQAGYTYTPPGNAVYIRVSYLHTDANKMQAEYGTNPTEYAAFSGPKVEDGIHLSDTMLEDGRNEFVAKEHVDLFDASTSVVGIIQANGTMNTAATAYKTSDYIPVKAGVTYKVYYLRALCAFNASKTAMPELFVDAATYNYAYTPTANGFIRWSYLATSESEQSLKTDALSNGKKLAEGVELSNLMREQITEMLQGREDDVFANKKWWACGDSFTEWTTETYVEAEAPNVTGLSRYKTYPYWIGKRNPLFTVHNYAVSGQTMATPASGDFTNAFSNDLYKNIPSDVDYITLYFGINDSHHRQGSSGGDGEDNTGVIPLGTINDETISTFYGAWNVVLRYLITNHPWAKIGIIITNGAETEDYPNAEIALAKKWGIPYLDLNGDYKLPLMLRANGKTEVCEEAVQIRKSQQWTDPSSNGHPNVNAHKFESTFIESWLRSL